MIIEPPLSERPQYSVILNVSEGGKCVLITRILYRHSSHRFSCCKICIECSNSGAMELLSSPDTDWILQFDSILARDRTPGSRRIPLYRYLFTVTERCCGAIHIFILLPEAAGKNLVSSPALETLLCWNGHLRENSIFYSFQLPVQVLGSMANKATVPDTKTEVPKSVLSQKFNFSGSERLWNHWP